MLPRQLPIVLVPPVARHELAGVARARADDEGEVRSELRRQLTQQMDQHGDLASHNALMDRGGTDDTCLVGGHVT